MDISGYLITNNGDVRTKDERFEYSSNLLIYKGENFTHDAGTDETSWHIWKFTWSSNTIVRKEGPLLGAWDDRATLGWGA